MRNRKFSLVTALLLLLLIAAIANIVFMQHAYNGALISLTPPPPTTVTGQQPPASSGGIRGEFVIFNWYGDIFLTPAEKGGYDLIAEAITRENHAPVPVDSIEVEFWRPGSSEAALIPVLQKTAVGKFTAHIAFPASGTWQSRTRIHRGLQTLEFTKKFEIH